MEFFDDWEGEEEPEFVELARRSVDRVIQDSTGPLDKSVGPSQAADEDNAGDSEIEDELLGRRRRSKKVLQKCFLNFLNLEQIIVYALHMCFQLIHTKFLFLKFKFLAFIFPISISHEQQKQQQQRAKKRGPRPKVLPHNVSQMLGEANMHYVSNNFTEVS
jgi:hypothetical protein